MMRKKMNEISSPVRWYDGMPMGPQHLQDAHMRMEDLMKFRFSMLNPYQYGIIKLKIDEERLKYNIFTVDEIECIMPDGLEINYISGIDHKLEVELTRFREKMSQQSRATVFLCVPHGKQIGHDQAKFTRFTAVAPDVIHDMNSGGESAGIPRYRANMSLQIGFTLLQSMCQFLLLLLILILNFLN